MAENILEVHDLEIRYVTDEETVQAVNDITFSLERGESIGLVGETGAGKTTTALGIMGLVPDPPGEIVKGSILFEGEDLLKLSEKQMRRIRGGKISMIFQDPMTSLNPVTRVGDQIAEVILLHNKISKAEARKRAMEMLEQVGIPGARCDDYPHQFSGGMKQRVMIAIALACSPELLIADEPTTALDVTIQAQVLELMKKLKQEYQTSLILIWALWRRSATRSRWCTPGRSWNPEPSRKFIQISGIRIPSVCLTLCRILRTTHLR